MQMYLSGCSATFARLRLLSLDALACATDLATAVRQSTQNPNSQPEPIWCLWQLQHCGLEAWGGLKNVEDVLGFTGTAVHAVPL